MLKEYAFANELALSGGDALETSQFLYKDTALALQLHDEHIRTGSPEQCVRDALCGGIEAMEVFSCLFLLHCLELVVQVPVRFESACHQGVERILGGVVEQEFVAIISAQTTILGYEPIGGGEQAQECSHQYGFAKSCPASLLEFQTLWSCPDKTASKHSHSPQHQQCTADDVPPCKACRALSR